MKNFTRIVGIIAMVAVMVFTVSCSKNEASGGSAAEAVASIAGGGDATPHTDFSYRLITADEKEHFWGRGATASYLPAAEEDKIRGLSDGVVITSYSGNGGKVVIPATIEDLPVIAIGNRAFQGETDTEYRPAYEITEVVIPEGVEAIGSEAFRGCDNLTTVTLPASLKFINYLAFWGCGELANLTIPDTASFIIGSWGPGRLIISSQKLPLKTRARLVELGHDEF